MRLLLDTHVFLWAVLRSNRLNASARQAIANVSNEAFVSAVSTWEIAIKLSIGKLELPGDAPLYVEQRMHDAGFTELPITQRHTLAVHGLPRHHHDPFDRLLVAQAQLEGLTIVTSDTAMTRYDVRTLAAG